MGNEIEGWRKPRPEELAAYEKSLVPLSLAKENRNCSAPAPAGLRLENLKAALRQAGPQCRALGASQPEAMRAARSLREFRQAPAGSSE